MANNNTPTSFKIRVIHRYLGFFLSGIMAVYALSGILMIFRETNFLKKEVVIEHKLEPNLTEGELSPKLRMGVKVEKKEGDVIYFKEGTYEMTFNYLKRKFEIRDGSYILWTGEPTTADINITAIYKVETAPIDLLDNQLSLLTPEERNTYKQKIPFETELKMTGELLKPNITFDITLPDGYNSVSNDIITKTEAKLAQLRQDPDNLNKQVFALLLLNRFIGEDPFSSESGGTTASSLARESASKILSQQLNNLAGDLIKGFEVDFDLDSYEDYTTGQRENKTDLNVGLSKKLLNDRLKVTVGSTFGIEGPEQKNKETNTIAGDISGEYILTSDGRYKLRAYRKNLYQVALQGQVIETGVGFVITLDYNKFRELFHSKKETEKPQKATTKSND